MVHLRRGPTMLRKRLLLLALVFAGALVLTLPATASATTATHYTFTGQWVAAAFDSAEACPGHDLAFPEQISRFAGVFAFNGRIFDENGRQSPTMLSVSVFESRFCDGTGTVTRDAYGTVDLTPGELTIPLGLGWAQVHATVPAYDSVTSQVIPVQVSLTWTATTDPAFHPTTIERFTFPDGSKFFFQSTGIVSRAGVARGTVSDGTRNYAVGDSFWAPLESVRDAALTITR
jgi:hypothetical protein